MPPLPSKPKGPALIPQALVLTALAATACSSQPPRIGQPPPRIGQEEIQQVPVRIGAEEPPPRIGQEEEPSDRMPVRIGAEPDPTLATDPSP